MVICIQCSTENKEDSKFCVNCGANLYPEKKREKREDACFGDSVDRDYLGLVSFGIFILIVGAIFATNPNVVSDFRLWIERLVNEQVFIRPPRGLITSATLFFGLLGISNFFIAVVRLVFHKAKRRVLTDIMSGVAITLFAYLIHLYGVYILTWQKVLALEVICCGLLVVSYSLVHYFFTHST